jgi:hypothetical protein
MFTRNQPSRARHRAADPPRHPARKRVLVSAAAVLFAVGSASSASAAIINTDDPTPEERLAAEIVADAGDAERSWDRVAPMDSILPVHEEAKAEAPKPEAAEVPEEEEPPAEDTADSSESSGSGVSVDIAADCSEYSGNKAVGCTMTLDAGWDMNEVGCLISLWDRESGWNESAYNSGSGAYGIPQSLPGDKMASHGDDWETNPVTQIAWGLDYIDGRYGSPCGAWSHSESNGWY